MSPATDATWHALHSRLRAFVSARVGNPADVDDILQEVFLRIHRHIDGLERADRLQAWVYQITRNAIVDHYRASGTRRDVPYGHTHLIELGESPPLPDETGGTSPEQELAGCLSPMLAQLPDHAREALVLTELEGVRQNVAAKQLGLSVSGMKSRVQRARRQLKELLLECCHIELDRGGGIVDYRLLPGHSCERCPRDQIATVPSVLDPRSEAGEAGQPRRGRP